MDLHKPKSRDLKRISETTLSRNAIENLLIGKLDSMWGMHNEKRNLEEFYKDFGYFFDGEYHNFSRIPPEQIQPGKENWEVDYKYNSHWFRSDNFKQIHNGMHIVFGGCSNTEGVGARIEKTWSHMVYNELCKDYEISGYFNLGKGGYGWHKIISSYLDYEKKFGSPDIFIVNHPNVLRDYYWDSKDSGWLYAQQYPYSANTGKNDASSLNDEELQKLKVVHGYDKININVFPTLEEYWRSFPTWLTAWNLFIQYCNSNNTKVIWGTWDSCTRESLTDCDLFLESYVGLDHIGESFIEEFRKDGKLEKDDMHARDGHPGFLVQLYWKDQFLKFIKDKGVLDEIYKKNNKEI